MSSKSFACLGAARRLWVAALAAIVSAGLLSACGGGGQVEPFVPTRVLAFGDDLSTIEADGRKYSINGLKTVTASDGTVTTSIDCTANPLWTQIVANRFSLVFDRCLGTATAASGQVLAGNGQKAGDFAAQIAAVQGTVLGEKDLALVMFGMNDILELYALYPTSSRDTLLAEARARGTALGEQVLQLAQRGPAVVVLTMPDLGQSPYALAQNLSTSDATRAALISALSEAFNSGLGLALSGVSGRLVGWVYADLELQNMVKFPRAFGLTNVTTAACKSDAPLPGCTSATLVDTATVSTWLWADDLRLSPAGQTRLGLLAESRARSNPF